MQWQRIIAALAAIALFPTLGQAENLVKEVKKAIERSTLDQPGTKPFHLVASLASSPERNQGSSRLAKIEIWWASPTRWKREVRSTGFHQVEIVDGVRDWQKNEGDFFPEWLREAAVELIKPVPQIDQVLDQVKTAELKRMGPTTSIDWITESGTPEVKNILRSFVAFQNSTGLLLYAGGFGWGAEFKDYDSFHGRMIARTVNVGSPPATAKIEKLEDLPEVPTGFFDATAQGGDSQPLQTLLFDEVSLRKNLLPMKPIVWPSVQDGPLEGNVTTIVAIDREGKVREIDSVMSENASVNDTGRQAVEAMRFKPFLVAGVPVQVVSQITTPFKTTRPTGVEAFESAQTYFERGRHLSFPAAGIGAAYQLRAEFEARVKSGEIEKGRYEDTWLSDTQWRREAWIAHSHYVRSRNGEKTYQFAEGDDASVLRLVFRALEPIPAIDTFVESDWRIKRDSFNGEPTVRVLAGYESPEGKLDPEQARGYWFDTTGLLLRTYFMGIETRRLEFADFAGVKIAHRIDVLKDGKVGMQIRITEVMPASPRSAKTCEVKGHEWKRAFTAEAR